MSVPLRKARKIVSATLAKGREMGLRPLSVVVVDAGGHPIAFEREDGSSPGRFKIAYGKANGCVMLGLPGSAIQARADAQAYFMQAMNGLFGGNLVPVQGCAMDAQGGAEVLDLLNELDTRCNVKIAHSVVLTRVNAAVTTRALHAAKDFLNGRGIETMTTPITERAAYRDVFDKGGLIHDLDPTEVSNLSRALDNAARFADEVLQLVPQRALLRRPSAAVPLRPAA